MNYGNVKKNFQEFLKTHPRTINLIVIFLIVIAIPLTVFIAQQQQNLRQHAQEAPPSYATNAPSGNCISAGYNVGDYFHFCQGRTDPTCNSNQGVSITYQCGQDGTWGVTTPNGECVIDCAVSSSPAQPTATPAQSSQNIVTDISVDPPSGIAYTDSDIVIKAKAISGNRVYIYIDNTNASEISSVTQSNNATSTSGTTYTGWAFLWLHNEFTQYRNQGQHQIIFRVDNNPQTQSMPITLAIRGSNPASPIPTSPLGISPTSIPVSPAPTNTQIACNDSDVTLTPQANVGVGSQINFRISGDASTYVNDDYQQAVNNCSGSWDNKTCTASQQGTFTWKHTWQHCVGSTNATNCSPVCQKTINYTVGAAQQTCTPSQWDASKCATCKADGSGWNTTCSDFGPNPAGTTSWCTCAQQCASSLHTTYNSTNYPACFAAPTTTPTTTTALSPTPTTLAGHTTLFVSFQLQGVTNPQNKNKHYNIEMFGTSGNRVLNMEGAADNFLSDGYYVNRLTLDPSSTTFFPSGLYTVKVRSNGFIKKLVPGIIQITSQQANQLPFVVLTAGDVNGDGQIDVTDWSIIAWNCFGDKANSSTCGPNKDSADLNGDGVVDGIDLNIITGNLRARSGD